MDTLCAVCINIFHGTRRLSRIDIHGRNSRVTNDGYALHDSDSDSNIEGSGTGREMVRKYYSHYANFIEFEQSAKKGCQLCRILFAQLSPDDVKEMHEYAKMVKDASPYRAKMYYSLWPRRDSPVDDSDDPPFELRVKGREVRADVRRHQGSQVNIDCKTMGISMSVVLEPAESIENLLMDHQISASTNSGSCYALAERWLASCTKSHPKCIKSRDDCWLPTRLVDIGIHDDNRGLRICESRSLPAGTRYLSLSHCWGLNPIIRCLKSNLDQFTEHIPFSKIPQTFQDAINITRYLYKRFRTQHLWIDSLCIIQDSDDDWRYEASNMGRVYANALCNIAATASRNGAEGCFRNRDTLLVRPFKAEAAWDGIHPGTYYGIDTTILERNVSQAPLNTRGWVVQERLLSPRILHFAADQLYWECLEVDASESFPGGMPRLMKGRFKDLDPRSAGEKDRVGTGLQSDNLLNIYSVWHKIVSTYTSGNLTKGSDKMVAISALAKQVQSQLGSENRYLAGLWEKYLASQLLWEVGSNGNSPPALPTEYRAPSWSWVSVDGHVQIPLIHQGNEGEVVLSVLAVDVITVGPDNFTGQVAYGYLRVRGRLIRGVMNYDLENEATLIINGNEVDWFISWDVEFGSDTQKPVYCLPIRKSFYGNSYEGLLLVPVLPAKGVFRRWGNFSAFQLGGGEFERAERLGEFEFEEFDGVDQYTITII